MAVKNYLDKTGLALVWEKIKNALSGKVDKVDGKGLSTNDYTADEKTKLANIAAGAQVNVIEGVQVNGANVSLVNKIANISVPTKYSDLSNDNNTVTDSSYVHTDNNYTTADKSKLSGIASGAEVNQNAFSNVKVGSTTIAADAKTDTLTLAAGTNITLTPDATNDKVTITAPSVVSVFTNDAGYLTDTDISAMVSNKADKATTLSGYGITDAYTKTQVNTSITSAVSNKADKATTLSGYGITDAYTKTQVNTSITSAVSNKADKATTLSGYGITNAYTKTETQNYVTGLGYQTAADVSAAISASVATVMNYKGTKATVSALPTTGNKTGDVWHVTEDNGEYAWNGSAWENLGPTIDLSGYVLTSELVAITAAEISTICV